MRNKPNPPTKRRDHEGGGDWDWIGAQEIEDQTSTGMKCVTCGATPEEDGVCILCSAQAYDADCVDQD